MFLNVGDKIVFMQALHDDDNSPIFLAVEAAARSVVIPFLEWHRLYKSSDTEAERQSHGAPSGGCRGDRDMDRRERL
jgi:hypothetical protein